MPAQMTNYPRPEAWLFKPADQKNIAPTIATDIAFNSGKSNVTHVVDSRPQYTREASLEQVANMSFNRYIFFVTPKQILKKTFLFSSESNVVGTFSRVLYKVWIILS